MHGRTKDASRKEVVRALEFSLRGFRGKREKESLPKAIRKDPTAPRLPRKEVAALQKTHAMKARIRSGTQGQPHGVRKAKAAWMRKEGFLPSAPGSKPADRPKVVRTAASYPVTFNLRSAVARFKRTGDLPDYDASTVEAMDSNGIDGRTLRRMIQAMLQRGNVETHPGPINQPLYWVYKRPEAVPPTRKSRRLTPRRASNGERSVQYLRAGGELNPGPLGGFKIITPREYEAWVNTGRRQACIYDGMHRTVARAYGSRRPTAPYCPECGVTMMGVMGEMGFHPSAHGAVGPGVVKRPGPDPVPRPLPRQAPQPLPRPTPPPLPLANDRPAPQRQHVHLAVDPDILDTFCVRMVGGSPPPDKPIPARSSVRAVPTLEDDPPPTRDSTPSSPFELQIVVVPTEQILQVPPPPSGDLPYIGSERDSRVPEPPSVNYDAWHMAQRYDNGRSNRDAEKPRKRVYLGEAGSISPDDLKRAHAILKHVRNDCQRGLRGHILTDAQIQKLADRLLEPHSSFMDEILIRKIGTQTCAWYNFIPYEGEHRCVSDRGVPEVKEDLQVAHVYYERPHFSWRGFLHKSLRALSYAATSPLCWFAGAVALNALAPVALPALASVMTGVASFAGTAAMVTAQIPGTENIGLFVRNTTAMEFNDTPIQRAACEVHYIPHMLTTAMKEYKAGCYESVDKTIEQKCLRQGCLPIPDDEALELVRGTTAACRAVANDELFTNRARPPHRRGAVRL